MIGIGCSSLASAAFDICLTPISSSSSSSSSSSISTVCPFHVLLDSDSHPCAFRLVCRFFCWFPPCLLASLRIFSFLSMLFTSSFSSLPYLLDVLFLSCFPLWFLILCYLSDCLFVSLQAAIRLDSSSCSFVITNLSHLTHYLDVPSSSSVPLSAVPIFLRRLYVDGWSLLPGHARSISKHARIQVYPLLVLFFFLAFPFLRVFLYCSFRSSRLWGSGVCIPAPPCLSVVMSRSLFHVFLRFFIAVPLQFLFEFWFHLMLFFSDCQ